jgi:hypothetical protein
MQVAVGVKIPNWGAARHIACPWLVERFADDSPEFLYVVRGADTPLKRIACLLYIG